MADAAARYAFPHGGASEDRRLDLFAQRLDPLTVRRISRLDLPPGARCLEVGGGRGSIARWLCEQVAPEGQVTATDLEIGFLSQLALPNLTVLRHDVRTDEFPAGSFDLIHARAVLMHIAGRMAVLRRMVSWLAPGGWLLVEEPDFGVWQGDFDPLWSAHPAAWHEAFPHGSMSAGRAILRQIHQLGLAGIGADAELDIVQPDTPLAEFHQLSMAAMTEPLVAAGVVTAAEAAERVARLSEPDFLGCGFAHIAAWGRRS
ncbi:MAG TPA: methyltransferase domain-containing protein [Streptosporangiaceae bacterium]|jgi:SAM-dependent methyltransferase